MYIIFVEDGDMWISEDAAQDDDAYAFACLGDSVSLADIQAHIRDYEGHDVPPHNI